MIKYLVDDLNNFLKPSINKEIDSISSYQKTQPENDVNNVSPYDNTKSGDNSALDLKIENPKLSVQSLKAWFSGKIAFKGY